jgi:hypothetical protein
MAYSVRGKNVTYTDLKKYVGNLTFGAQLVLCSTKSEEAASIFTTLVRHAEQNHGRLG